MTAASLDYFTGILAFAGPAGAGRTGVVDGPGRAVVVEVEADLFGGIFARPVELVGPKKK
jgi:hypothetical protein